MAARQQYARQQTSLLHPVIVVVIGALMLALTLVKGACARPLDQQPHQSQLWKSNAEENTGEIAKSEEATPSTSFGAGTDIDSPPYASLASKLEITAADMVAASPVMTTTKSTKRLSESEKDISTVVSDTDDVVVPSSPRKETTSTTATTDRGARAMTWNHDTSGGSTWDRMHDAGLKPVHAAPQSVTASGSRVFEHRYEHHDPISGHMIYYHYVAHRHPHVVVLEEPPLANAVERIECEFATERDALLHDRMIMASDDDDDEMSSGGGKGHKEDEQQYYADDDEVVPVVNITIKFSHRSEGESSRELNSGDIESLLGDYLKVGAIFISHQWWCGGDSMPDSHRKIMHRAITKPNLSSARIGKANAASDDDNPTSTFLSFQATSASFHECFEEAEVEFFKGHPDTFRQSRGNRRRSLEEKADIEADATMARHLEMAPHANGLADTEDVIRSALEQGSREPWWERRKKPSSSSPDAKQRDPRHIDGVRGGARRMLPSSDKDDWGKGEQQQASSSTAPSSSAVDLSPSPTPVTTTTTTSDGLLSVIPLKFTPVNASTAANLKLARKVMEIDLLLDSVGNNNSSQTNNQTAVVVHDYAKYDDNATRRGHEWEDVFGNEWCNSLSNPDGWDKTYFKDLRITGKECKPGKYHSSLDDCVWYKPANGEINLIPGRKFTLTWRADGSNTIKKIILYEDDLIGDDICTTLKYNIPSKTSGNSVELEIPESIFDESCYSDMAGTSFPEFYIWFEDSKRCHGGKTSIFRLMDHRDLSPGRFDKTFEDGQSAQLFKFSLDHGGGATSTLSSEIACIGKCGISGTSEAHVYFRTSELNPLAETWSWANYDVNAIGQLKATLRYEFEKSFDWKTIISRVCLEVICIGARMASIEVQIGVILALRARAEVKITAEASISMRKPYETSLKGGGYLHTQGATIISREVNPLTISPSANNDDLMDPNSYTFRVAVGGEFGIRFGTQLFVGIFAGLGILNTQAYLKMEPQVKPLIGVEHTLVGTTTPTPCGSPYDDDSGGPRAYRYCDDFCIQSQDRGVKTRQYIDVEGTMVYGTKFHVNVGFWGATKEWGSSLETEYEDQSMRWRRYISQWCVPGGVSAEKSNQDACLEENVDYSGNSFVTWGPIGDLQACSDRCLNDDRCKFFTYNNGGCAQRLRHGRAVLCVVGVRSWMAWGWILRPRMQ